MATQDKYKIRIIRTEPTEVIVYNKPLMIIVGFFTRFIFRIMSTPIYALVAAPWIFITFIDYGGNGTLQRFIVSSIAWMSGNPSATSLDETDLGAAVLTMFVIFSILAELLNLIFKKKKTIGISSRQRLKIMLVITAVGWIIFAIKFFNKFGIQGVFFATVTGIISTLFITKIHSMNEIFSILTDKKNI